MAKYLSKYIPCTVCDKPANHVTEWKYKGNECYLCDLHNNLYINNMMEHEPIDEYPRCYRAHEVIISNMKESMKLGN